MHEGYWGTAPGHPTPSPGACRGGNPVPGPCPSAPPQELPFPTAFATQLCTQLSNKGPLSHPLSHRLPASLPPRGAAATSCCRCTAPFGAGVTLSWSPRNSPIQYWGDTVLVPKDQPHSVPG